MTTRRSVPALLLIALVALVALTVLPAAGAAGTTAKPEPGPLSPAFVDALHDPLVTLGLGRVPSPVEVRVGAAAEARAARMSEPSYFSLVDEGRMTPVKDQLADATCWAFANVAALESRLMPADPAPDYSEDNVVSRSGYGPFPYGTDGYGFGGYDFMAVAYFARWAGPLLETDDPYPTRGSTATLPVQKHVQGAVMIPGRSSATDNDLIKRLVRENGALSVGMWIRRGLDGAISRSTRTQPAITPRTTSPTPWARTTAWPSSAGTTPIRRQRLPRRRRAAARRRRVPGAQQLGQRLG